MQHAIENISELVQQGAFGEIIGRDEEIQRLTEILTRNKRHHVILLGNMGVGCSSIVEGFAKKSIELDQFKSTNILRIKFDVLLATSDVPLRILDQTLQAIQNQPKEIVIVFDELDALLQFDIDLTNKFLMRVKHLLTYDHLRLILLCSNDFYKNSIVPDSYLLRYFMPMPISAPPHTKTIEMVRAHLPQLQNRYTVNISSDVIEKVVQLSKVYLPLISLPESAIDLLDAVAARVSSRQQIREITLLQVAELLSEWTGIAETTLLQSEEEKIVNISEALSKDIFGQEEAIAAVESALQTHFLRLNDHVIPPTLLLVGPQGVGKESAALSLTQALYGTENHLFHFDMSKYSTPQHVELLLGPYNTTGTIGAFTQVIQRCPYSVCIFDHIEAAHLDVLHALEKVISDGKVAGHDLKNSIMILTTSLGADSLSAIHHNVSSSKEDVSGLLQLVVDDLPELQTKQETMRIDLDTRIEDIKPHLMPYFSDRFLQHITWVPFAELSSSDLIQFAEDQLFSLSKNISKQHQVRIQIDSELPIQLLNALPHNEHSITSIQRFIQKKILPEVSRQILISKSQSLEVNQLTVSMDQRGHVQCSMNSNSIMEF